MNAQALCRYVIVMQLLGAGCSGTGAERGVGSLTVEQRHNREMVLQRLLSVSVAGLAAGGEADLGVAEDALQFAAEIAPADCRVLDGLGAVAWRRCRSAEAKELFKAAIVADPNYSRPYAHLALVAEADGDTEAALALLAEALVRNPLNYRARAHREAILARQRERDFAKRSVRQVEGCHGTR